MGELEEELVGTNPEETDETPTIESLQSELEKANRELEQTRKGLKTAHHTLTSKDKALKRQQDWENNINLLTNKVDLIAQTIAELRPVSKDNEDDLFGGEEKKGTRTDINKTFKDMDSQQRFKAYQEQIANIQRKALEVGLGESDIAYWDIAECARQGQFQKADLLISQYSDNKTKSRSEQLKTQAKELAEQYGVKENELIQINDSKDMKIYALEHATKRPGEIKPKPRYEAATPSTMPKSVWGKSREEFLKDVEKQKKEALARKQS